MHPGTKRYNAALPPDARAIQWDYKNLVRRKGRLERLK